MGGCRPGGLGAEERTPAPLAPVLAEGLRPWGFQAPGGDNHPGHPLVASCWAFMGKSLTEQAARCLLKRDARGMTISQDNFTTEKNTMNV